MSRGRGREPPPDDGPSCAGCRHWHEKTSAADTERWGECQANPPTVISEGEGPYCVTPWTELPYVCRLHTPRTH